MEENEGVAALSEMAEREAERAEKAEAARKLQRGYRANRFSQQELIKRDRGVITIDGKLDADTPEAEYEQTLIDLRESERGGRVLTGVLSGMLQSENVMPCAKIFYGDWTVLIPVEKLIPENMMPENRGNREAHLNYLGLLIAQRERSEIQFVVEKDGIDETNLLVAATRLRAMQQVRAAYYWGRDRKNGHYLLEEGQIVEGRVMTSLPHEVCVEVFGAECRVPSSECSYNRINPEEYWSPGDRVNVLLTKLERKLNRDANGKVIRDLDITVSIKAAQENPRVKNFSRFGLNEQTWAEVTYVSPTAGIFCHLAGTEAEAKILIPRGLSERVREGDICSVRIVGKDPERYFIFCEIIRKLQKKERSPW